MTLVEEEVLEATPIVTAIPVPDPQSIATPVASFERETCRIVAPATLPEGATFQATLDGVVFTARVPRGGVRKGEFFETMYPKMIQVMAPSTLNAGDRFEAEYEGIRFWATVPAGGVREGDLFETLHPSVALLQGKNVYHPRQRNGKWRTGLCECCDSSRRGCCELCCMGCACSICLNGQLIQRMKLNFAGCPGGINRGNVCVLHAGITIGLILLMVVFGALYIDSIFALAYLGFLAWTIFLFVAMVCARKSMREHYKLDGVCCIDGDCLDDCCVTYWCSCCSLIQMANQTHDPKLYAYHCCTATGLGPDAPPYDTV